MDGNFLVAPETPLDSPLDDERDALHPDTPAREYLLTHENQAFSVIQYDDDNEVSETIDGFILHCKDMGWAVKRIR